MKLDELGKLSCFRHRNGVFFVALICLLYQNLSLCCSLNDEGLALLKLRERIVHDPFGVLSDWNDDNGELDPCSWFGIECSDGKVVILNLKNLCLGGTLAPELGNLAQIKSIILRNNSFSGIIPEELGELKELEVLDLGYNNFSGPVPANIGISLSMTILLLDNNRFLESLSPELYKLKMIAEVQMDRNQLYNAVKRSSCNKRFVKWISARNGDGVRRVLLQSTNPGRNIATNPSPSSSPSPSLSPAPSPSSSPTPSPSPSPSLSPTPSPSPLPSLSPTPSPSPLSSLESPTPSPLPNNNSTSPNLDPATSKHRSKSNRALVLVAIIGGSILIFVSIISFIFFKCKQATTVKPWTTGLSGQLQKAFITGVPNLKRLDIVEACEDFSNVIGSSSIGTVYKGTLSSGVEIAVVCIAAKSWSMNLEEQFRKKIDTLSTVNHKNFVSLIGYCCEEEPFTRMMVFEYAPNGTLFEHLHIKEAEHLDWGMRLRIIVGMAYCLEHMHQESPPTVHKNLISSAINLTEDYAAKISDFSFWNESDAVHLESTTTELLSAGPESNIYNFGVILFEIITGRLPFSVDNHSHDDWASDYLKAEQPIKQMVDPTLNSFDEDQLERIYEVIKYCVNPDPRKRPAMKEITERLRYITGIGPDGAAPRLSPLWWAELEILSTEAS